MEIVGWKVGVSVVRVGHDVARDVVVSPIVIIKGLLVFGPLLGEDVVWGFDVGFKVGIGLGFVVGVYVISTTNFQGKTMATLCKKTDTIGLCFQLRKNNLREQVYLFSILCSPLENQFELFKICSKTLI